MTPEETRKKALEALNRRDYGSAELAAKLVEKGADPADAEAAVRYMIRVGFIDDARYAAMVARHYAAKGYGAARVREELRRRKIDRSLWDDALSGMPDNSDAAYKLFAARMRGGTGSDAVRRASAALIRRGFGWDAVKAAAERYLAEMEIEE